MKTHNLKLLVALLLSPSLVWAQSSGEIFKEAAPYELVFAGSIGQWNEGAAMAPDG